MLLSKNEINALVITMAKNDTRPFLNGMRVKAGGGKIRFSTSDGHRLAYIEKSWSGESLDIIIPHEVVLLGAKTEVHNISESAFGMIQYKPINAEYPLIERVFTEKKESVTRLKNWYQFGYLSDIEKAGKLVSGVKGFTVLPSSLKESTSGIEFRHGEYVHFLMRMGV